MRRNKGFTLVELLVVIAIIALLIGLLLPALSKARRNAATLKDKTQIKQIHQAMLIWAEDNNNWLPLPGFINRVDDPTLGPVPGVGLEDRAMNTTDNLYSAMVAQEFIPPELLIGPTEVNELVPEEGYDTYNFESYDPSADVYWDDEFSADIEQGNADFECHTSYFHMALLGERKRFRWKNTQEADEAVVATRGTERGDVGDPDYKFSQTLELHGADKEWRGNVCFNDNHVDTLDTFWPPAVGYIPNTGAEIKKDNIYDYEFTDYDDEGFLSADNFLCMYESISVQNNEATAITPLYDNLTIDP